MRASRYSAADAERWDRLIDEAPMGTFLHTRRFLSYHGDRFVDCSIVIEDERGSLWGVLPAALTPGVERVAVSHPGATYGGIVHAQRNAALHVPQMLEAASHRLRDEGVTKLVYKPVPAHLQHGPCQADVHTLWRQGARLIRRDLWNVLDLARTPVPSANRKRTVARAHLAGVTVREDNSGAAYEAFHDILVTRLRERYSVEPTHTVEEMVLLRERFPQVASLWLALDRSEAVLAGSWVFDVGRAARHTQYLASTAEGRALFAMDLLIQMLIDDALSRGMGAFSLGASTEPDGSLNAGLFDYKSRFGPGSIVHDHYELDLDA
jgi:hypothetical protein